MTPTRKLAFFILFTLVLSVFWMPQVNGLAAQDTIVIIANKNLPLNELTHTDLQNIFLGKQVHWNNGERIEFVVLDKSGQTGNIHESFTRNYLRKSASQYLNYWKKMVFTGKGNPPKSFNNENGLVDYVGSTKGSIGYISSQTAQGDAENVKIIRVVQ